MNVFIYFGVALVLAVFFSYIVVFKGEEKLDQEEAAVFIALVFVCSLIWPFTGPAGAVWLFAYKKGQLRERGW